MYTTTSLLISDLYSWSIQYIWAKPFIPVNYSTVIIWAIYVAWYPYSCSIPRWKDHTYKNKLPSIYVEEIIKSSHSYLDAQFFNICNTSPVDLLNCWPRLAWPMDLARPMFWWTCCLIYWLTDSIVNWWLRVWLGGFLILF